MDMVLSGSVASEANNFYVMLFGTWSIINVRIVKGGRTVSNWLEELFTVEVPHAYEKLHQWKTELWSRGLLTEICANVIFFHQRRPYP